MKKVGITLTIVLVIALALPFGFGWYTEGQIRQQIEQSNESPLMNISVKEYARGWFDSEVIVEVALSENYRKQIQSLAAVADKDPDAPVGLNALSDFRYPVKMIVGHGPLLRGDGAKFGLWESSLKIDSGAGFIDELKAQTGIQYLVKGYTHTDFSGLSHFQSNVPVINFADAGNRFEFGGLQFSGTYNASTRDVVGTGAMPSFVLDTPQASVTLGKTTFDGAFKMISTYLYLGDFNGVVEQMDIKPKKAGEPQMVMQQLSFGTSVSQQSNTSPIDVGAKYAVKSISSEAFNLADFVLDLTIKNLDRGFLEEYYALTQNLAALQMGADPAMFEKFQSLALKFLSASPGIEIKPLSFIFNDGPVNLVLDLTTDGSQVTSADQLTLANLQSLRQIINATANLEVGKAMALDTVKTQIKNKMRVAMEAQGQEPTPEQLEEVANQQAPLMIASLIEQGFVEETDTTYRSAATIDKGVVNVNGNALPF